MGRGVHPLVRAPTVPRGVTACPGHASCHPHPGRGSPFPEFPSPHSPRWPRAAAARWERQPAQPGPAPGGHQPVPGRRCGLATVPTAGEPWGGFHGGTGARSHRGGGGGGGGTVLGLPRPTPPLDRPRPTDITAVSLRPRPPDPPLGPRPLADYPSRHAARRRVGPLPLSARRASPPLRPLSRRRSRPLSVSVGAAASGQAPPCRPRHRCGPCWTSSWARPGTVSRSGRGLQETPRPGGRLTARGPVRPGPAQLSSARLLPPLRTCGAIHPRPPGSGLGAAERAGPVRARPAVIPPRPRPHRAPGAAPPPQAPLPRTGVGPARCPTSRGA